MPQHHHNNNSQKIATISGQLRVVEDTTTRGPAAADWLGKIGGWCCDAKQGDGRGERGGKRRRCERGAKRGNGNFDPRERRNDGKKRTGQQRQQRQRRRRVVETPMEKSSGNSEVEAGDATRREEGRQKMIVLKKSSEALD